MYHTILLFIAILAGPTVHSGNNNPPPSPVKNFNAERYQGVWHQLSAIPASFQKKCVSNTTAEYTLLSDGLIKVVNRCKNRNNKYKVSEARARINQDYDLSSTLEVTFVKLFGWVWSFAGDYWITYINKKYDIAIVGHPNFDYGWILSKKESLSLIEYKKLNKELKKQGYDSCRFIMSNTPDQSFETETRLCELTGKR